METAIDNSIKRFQKRRSELERLIGSDLDISMISCFEDEDDGDREYRLRVTIDETEVSLKLRVGHWRPGALFYEIRRQVDWRQTTRDPKRVIQEVKTHAEAWA